VSRVFRVSFLVGLAALALSGCMQRRGPVAQQPFPPQPYAQAPLPAPAQPGIDAVAYGQGVYGQPAGPAPAPMAAMPPPIVAEPPPVITGSVVRPSMVSSRPGLLSNVVVGRGRRPAHATPVAYAPPAPVIIHDPAYRLDAGDRLRVVVFGQEGLTNAYSVDAAGVITMPLIGSVSARGCTPAELAAMITAKLKGGFIREPYVAVEIEAYRPFFILGEVAAPGQYPFVPNMTAESAVAIAGGFTPRAKRNVITITRSNEFGQTRIVANPQLPLKPGDTITIGERWF
jgi:polysaccharide export outer membrane protein